ncbi:MAG: hypothetical protein AAB723_03170 [Patescibacteria group bacterium]
MGENKEPKSTAKIIDFETGKEVFKKLDSLEADMGQHMEELNCNVDNAKQRLLNDGLILNEIVLGAFQVIDDLQEQINYLDVRQGLTLEQKLNIQKMVDQMQNIKNILGGLEKIGSKIDEATSQLSYLFGARGHKK